ncbi:MAG: electron transfer flavoprotein subunit beta/FixA family protein [Anaerolineales bacterium]
MPELHSVVCVKVVPKPEEIRVDPETKLLVRGNTRSEINPPDMNAMEMALSLKDRYGGQISLLSMGPSFFESNLRVALAMGADHIYLLSDPAFAGADTLATTYTLAQGIRKIGDVDLVLCGEESSDGATGQVPPGLAEWLEVSQLTLLTEVNLDLEQKTARGRREIRGGYEILEVHLPSVVSVKTACNEPRFMDFQLRSWSLEEERVTIWGVQDLEVDPGLIGLPGSPTIVSGLAEAPFRERKREFLQGNPQDIAEQLVPLILKVI